VSPTAGTAAGVSFKEDIIRWVCNEKESSSSSLTNAVASSLQWMDSQGTWQSGWNGAYFYVVPPASASWVTQYQSVSSSQ
jgi:hypothetical protein